MPTVQVNMLKLALRIDPKTKNDQVFQDNSASVVITNATNASPIVVTAAGHGLLTGHQVYITGVVGNTAANNTSTNPNWTITKVDANTFSLDGSSGNGAYSSGGTVVGALIGSVDGSFSRQRLLDIYNEARMTILQLFTERGGEQEAIRSIDGNILSNQDITFATGSAAKPTGFVKEVLLRDPSGNTVSIVDANELPSVQQYDATATKFVYRSGTTFKGQSSVVITNGTYKLWYYGITDFTLTDVLVGTAVETFNVEHQPKLIELAVAIATEHGNVSPMALARKIFGDVVAK